MTKTYTRHDIYEQLYGEIMTLQRKPGSTLRENALCEEFGVSRTPIRSVLQELRIAGLIEVTPYKSARVTRLDFDTISQQIYLRVAVETAVLLDFFDVCTPEQMQQLYARNQALRRQAEQPTPDPAAAHRMDGRLRAAWGRAPGQPAVAADPDQPEQLFPFPDAGPGGSAQLCRDRQRA